MLLIDRVRTFMYNEKRGIRNYMERDRKGLLWITKLRH